jgi:hypothetical protein
LFVIIAENLMLGPEPVIVLMPFGVAAIAKKLVRPLLDTFLQVIHKSLLLNW